MHMLISGQVQGVGYRYWTQQRAQQLHLTGWVRNLHDGRVEVLVNGPHEALQRLLILCREGPSSARVDQVRDRTVREAHFDGFDIPASAPSPASLQAAS